MQPPIAPRQVSQQDINRYVQDVLQGKVKDLSEYEQEAAQQLQRIANETAQKKLRLDALQDEAKNLESDLKMLAGQRQAYVTMLFTAKIRREEPQTTPAVSSLEDLRKKIGAKKIERISKEGKKVAETEEASDLKTAESPGQTPADPDNPAGDPEPENRDLEPGEMPKHTEVPNGAQGGK